MRAPHQTRARTAGRAVLTGSLAGLMACSGGAPGAGAGQPTAKPAAGDYGRAEVTLMGGDLVQVRVAMRGQPAPEDLEAYGRCVMAGYAMKNKAGFLRHVRTVTDKVGGISQADAVYSVTAALPEGLQTIDADVTVDDCRTTGIPTDISAGISAGA